MDSNARINLSCVIGVLTVAGILALGAIALSACRYPVPDFMGNAIIGITGGIIGYLARDVKHPPANVAVEDAKEVIAVGGKDEAHG